MVLMANRGTRPGRAEIDAAALELLARHGSQILARAVLYGASPEDAEDDFQRGLEILLTDADTGAVVSLDYRKAISLKLARGASSQVRLRIPAGMSLPGRIRAYVITDAVALAEREL